MTDTQTNATLPLYKELERLRVENASFSETIKMLANQFTNGAGLIAQERRRQIEEEGFDQKHDEQHSAVDLAVAGACYALAGVVNDPAEPIIGPVVKEYWPFAKKWWKPKDDRRNLIRAGALIAAALDRLEAEGK